MFPSLEMLSFPMDGICLLSPPDLFVEAMGREDAPCSYTLKKVHLPALPLSRNVQVEWEKVRGLLKKPNVEVTFEKRWPRPWYGEI